MDTPGLSETTAEGVPTRLVIMAPRTATGSGRVSGVPSCFDNSAKLPRASGCIRSGPGRSCPCIG
jgi:hypothetical protein